MQGLPDLSVLAGDLPERRDPRLPRYSARSLPAYRYVPGARPHPTRDPAGHSYEPTVRLNRHAPWDPEQWRALDDWLYGVDLFNRFYFWEAHEAWEGLWAAVARDSAPALLLQGLIQIAAALLKTHMRVPAGAHTLSAEGIEKVRRAAFSQPLLLGLPLPVTAERFAAYFAPLAHKRLPSIGPEVPVVALQDR